MIIKRLLLSLLLILAIAVGAECEVFYSNDFDYFTSDVIRTTGSDYGGAAIADTPSGNFYRFAVLPCTSYCYTQCHNQNWPIQIITDASRVQGTNKRGFRRPWAWNASGYYDSTCLNCNGGGIEDTLQKQLSQNYTKMYIRWYERPSWDSITSQYIKIFRLYDSGFSQNFVVEWRTDISGQSGKALMIVTGNPWNWTKDFYWTGFDYRTYAAAHHYEWTAFELMIDMAGNDMDFWVNGVLQTGKTRNGSTMCTNCDNIRYVGIGGNTTAISADNNQYADYDDIKLSTTYVGTEENPPAVTYSIGGGLSDLGTGKSVTLRNTIDGSSTDDKQLTVNGAYQFTTELETGQNYAVTVQSQPVGQTCQVANGSGQVATSDITNVNVTCSDNPTTSNKMGGGRVSGGNVR